MGLLSDILLKASPKIYNTVPAKKRFLVTQATKNTSKLDGNLEEGWG
jgi:hypothetical protein